MYVSERRMYGRACGRMCICVMYGTPLTILCVDVHQWEYEEEGYPPVTLGIWDFAGQEVYYTTHQFFLTTRSIYVIVFSILPPIIFCFFFFPSFIFILFLFSRFIFHSFSLFINPISDP
jgi:hypothetical protein